MLFNTTIRVAAANYIWWCACCAIAVCSNVFLYRYCHCKLIASACCCYWYCFFFWLSRLPPCTQHTGIHVYGQISLLVAQRLWFFGFFCKCWRTVRRAGVQWLTAVVDWLSVSLVVGAIACCAAFRSLNTTSPLPFRSQFVCQFIYFSLLFNFFESATFVFILFVVAGRYDLQSCDFIQRFKALNECLLWLLAILLEFVAWRYSPFPCGLRPLHLIRVIRLIHPQAMLLANAINCCISLVAAWRHCVRRRHVRAWIFDFVSPIVCTDRMPTKIQNENKNVWFQENGNVACNNATTISSFSWNHNSNAKACMQAANFSQRRELRILNACAIAWPSRCPAMRLRLGSLAQYRCCRLVVFIPPAFFWWHSVCEGDIP